MILIVVFIFVFLICLTILFYKYIMNILNKFNLNKKKYIKYIVLVLSILVLYGCAFTTFISNVSAISIIILLYMIGAYFVVILLNVFLKKYKMWNKIYLFLPILFSICFTIYGIYNMSNIRVTKYTIHNSELNNNYKIVLISDLHYGISLNDNDLKKYSNEISNLNPDFIVLAGDIVDERTTKQGMINAFKILGSIKTKYGIYYSYGNHDKNVYVERKNYTLDELQKNLIDNNIIILEDSKKYINDDLLLIGRRYGERNAISEMLDEDDNRLYSIVIDHVPLEYKNNIECGVNLELSGHTHNGQIFPMGLMQKVYNKIVDYKNDPINSIHKLSDFVYGKYEKDDFVGIVTSGIAGWGIPIRTEGKSEYVVINLSK